jgi:hypothetical protein
LHTLLHTYGDASPEPVPLGSLSPDEAPNSIHLTLLDTLPSFLALSASPTLMQDATTTALWMRLAARYMAQAALEQYLVFGTGESEKVLEAFSWGFDLGEIDNDEAEGMDLDGTGSGEDELAIANLFWNGSEGDFEDADGGEVAEWAGIRREHLEAVSYMCFSWFVVCEHNIDKETAGATRRGQPCRPLTKDRKRRTFDGRVRKHCGRVSIKNIRESAQAWLSQSRGRRS